MDHRGQSGNHHEGKAFGLEGRAAWLSTLPSLFLLLFITRMDYSIYLFRTYGLMYSQVLGFCVTSALVLLYRKGFLGKRTGSLFVAAAVLTGYPLFGAFALLAALLMGMLDGCAGNSLGYSRESIGNTYTSPPFPIWNSWTISSVWFH